MSSSPDHWWIGVGAHPSARRRKEGTTLAHVDPEKFAHVGELLDTWGHSCMAELPSGDDCDEHIRTVGIAILVEDEPEPLVFAFCLQHMCDWLERVVYGRRIAEEIVPEEDNGDEE